jgi:hypothetical protein
MTSHLTGDEPEHVLNDQVPSWPKEKPHDIRLRRCFRGGGGMSASNERVAIVAGAGGELGRVTAEKLAAAGFTTVG